MKISPSSVRRLRLERGWSQEQLAVASGLSLRTVQRVEAEGVASLATAASLAATYAVPLIQLQDAPPPCADGHGRLFLAIALLMLAALGESGRVPGGPVSEVSAALNLLVAAAGGLLFVPAVVRVVRARRYAGAALAAMGTPLVTLLLGGVVVALLGGRAPLWPLLGVGACGVVLVGLAARELRRKTGAADA